MAPIAAVCLRTSHTYALAPRKTECTYEAVAVDVIVQGVVHATNVHIS